MPPLNIGDEYRDGWIVVAIDSSLARYEGDTLVARGVQYTVQKEIDGVLRTRDIPVLVAVEN